MRFPWRHVPKEEGEKSDLAAWTWPLRCRDNGKPPNIDWGHGVGRLHLVHRVGQSRFLSPLPICPLALGEEAAIHEKRLAADERGSIIGEIDHRLRHVFDATDAPHRRER